MFDIVCPTRRCELLRCSAQSTIRLIAQFQHDEPGLDITLEIVRCRWECDIHSGIIWYISGLVPVPAATCRVD
jgi:hypothetical protein